MLSVYTSVPERFLALMKITPVSGNNPNLEFEYADQGDTFKIVNRGNDPVNVDITLTNSFDPVIDEGDDILEVRKELGLPQYKSIPNITIKANTVYSITFSKWWSYQESKIDTQETGINNEEANGCSCRSVGERHHTPLVLPIIIIGLLALVFRKWC